MNRYWLLGVISAAIWSQLAGYDWLPHSAAHAQNPAHVQRLLSTRSCPDCDLSGISLEEIDLSGANLQNADLSGASLLHTQLVRANLEGANLSKSMLLGVDLTGANLRSANLSDARSFFICDDPVKSVKGGAHCIRQVLLVRLGVRSLCQGRYGLIVFESAFCDERNLTPAIELFERFRASPSDVYVDEFEVLLFDNAHYVTMQGADLSGATLAGAQLQGVDFRYASLSGAYAEDAALDYALMLHTDIVGLQGAALDNSWTTAEGVSQWLEDHAIAENLEDREDDKTE